MVQRLHRHRGRRLARALLLLAASACAGPAQKPIVPGSPPKVAAGGALAEGAAALERRDFATALREFQPLAEQGFREAQFILGLMYANGQGVPQDDAEAARWYRKAADQGYPVAQTNLGLMYAKGQGVPQDFAEAVKWYRKAADQGNPGAQTSLGVMYDNGEGVPQDDAEAARWYRKAADMGYPLAQTELGFMYADQHYVQAYLWLSLALANPGLKGALGGGTFGTHFIAMVRSSLDAITRKMTPAQIAEAQRLVREWKPKSE